MSSETQEKQSHRAQVIGPLLVALPITVVVVLEERQELREERWDRLDD